MPVIHFTTDPESLPKTEGEPEYVITHSRYRFKETGGSNDSFEWFRASVAKHGMYFIVPLPMKPKGDMDVYMEHLLGKTKVYIRDFSVIAADDVDSIALET